MTKYSDKIIFIPVRLKTVSFKWLPVSDSLASYLKQNNLNTISDLQKIKGENLEKILESPMKPFPELRHYILAFQEKPDEEIKLQTFERKDEGNDETAKTPTYLSQTVFVPLAARKWEIAHLPVSESLINNLIKCGYKTLDDLHGSVYSRFTDARFFEKNDVVNLWFLVSQLKSDEVFRSVEETISKARGKNETIDRLPPMLRKKVNTLKTNFKRKGSVGQSSSVNSNNQFENSDVWNQDISSITDNSEAIETPASLRALPIEHLAPSDKLNAAFKKEKFMFVGQFDGWLYRGLEKKLKLRKSETDELRRLIWFAKKYSRYTVFKSGFENIKKAAEKHKENVEKLLAVSGKIERKIPALSSSEVQSSDGKFVVPATSKQKFIVPLQLKKMPLAEFDLSIKLAGMLNNFGIEFVGNLEKICFEDFTKARFCTNQVTEEFRQFLYQLEKFEAQSAELLHKPTKETNDSTVWSYGARYRKPILHKPTKETNDSTLENSSTKKFIIPSFSEKFTVPAHLQKIPISEFALTIKITRMFQKLGVVLVGNLNKISFKDFTQAPLYNGRIAVEFRQFLSRLEKIEAQSFEIPDQPAISHPQTFDSAELMKFINDFASKLSPVEREIFSDRFGGANDEEILAFDEIAVKLEISREKTYQIFVRNLNKLKEILPNQATDALKNLRDECISTVCPLTPKFLVKLVNNDYELFHFPAAFYIRLFSLLFPPLPILPKIENRTVNLKPNAKKIEQKIKSFLETQYLPVSLAEVFNQTTVYHSDKENIENDFFEAIQSVKFNLITTENPHELFIESNETT